MWVVPLVTDDVAIAIDMDDQGAAYGHLARWDMEPGQHGGQHGSVSADGRWHLGAGRLDGLLAHVPFHAGEVVFAHLFSEQ